MRIGIVGTGSFAALHARLVAKMDGVTVAAVCGTAQEKADRFASEFSSAIGYTSVEHMTDKERLDAVYVCVPPFAHGDIERALIERGMPMLVEKPLGLPGSQIGMLAEEVERKGLITSVGYHWWYLESTERAVQLLEGRTFGMALGYWNGSMPKVGWWRKQDGSGGQFVEQTTHIVDLLRYAAGEVTEVYAAFAQRTMHRTLEGVEVADVGTVSLKLANGAVASIVNTCMLPFYQMTGLQLFTDEGVLELGRDELKVLRDGSSTVYANRMDPYIRENEAFLHAVKTGDPSGIRSTYQDAWKSHQVTTAAVRFAEIGLPVKVGEG